MREMLPMVAGTDCRPCREAGNALRNHSDREPAQALEIAFRNRTVAWQFCSIRFQKTKWLSAQHSNFQRLENIQTKLLRLRILKSQPTEYFITNVPISTKQPHAMKFFKTIFVLMLVVAITGCTTISNCKTQSQASNSPNPSTNDTMEKIPLWPNNRERKTSKIKTAQIT
ncbi:MAG: hypothetical protein MJ106_02115 [Lentisphaeria bacterium]|nr:hypothetical protein [Lentisphaeria bacterium]